MIDAMKQGLAVINGLPTCNHHHGIDCPNCAHINNAAAALRAAIAAAERAEPVAWGNIKSACLHNERYLTTNKQDADEYMKHGPILSPLYAHPPAITDEIVKRAALAVARQDAEMNGCPKPGSLGNLEVSAQYLYTMLARAALEAAWAEARALLAQPERDEWRELFWRLATLLNCLPSTFANANDHVFRRVTQLLAQPQWQPIETAPKDGTTVIAYRPTDPPHIEGMQWGDHGDGTGAWYWSYDGDSPQELQPTHWMPLPKPPEE